MGAVGCVRQMWSGGDHFLLRKGRRVKEGLRWRLAEAPSPLMGPFFVVALNPGIEVVLKFGDRSIDLLAKGDTIELVEHRLVEALDDAIIRYEIGGASWSGCSREGAGDMVSPSGTRGAGSTKVRAGRR